MNDKIESYIQIEQKLIKSLQEAQKCGLDSAVLAGVLLDLRDYVKIHGEVPKIEDE